MTVDKADSSTIEVGEAAMSEASDPHVTPYREGIVVTLYGRPFQLSLRAARELAWGLVSTIEEFDRTRRN